MMNLAYLRTQQRRLLQSLSGQRYNQAAVAHVLPNSMYPTDDIITNKQKLPSNESFVGCGHFSLDKPFDPRSLNIDLTFSNTNDAFKSKRLPQLLRNYLVLSLCSSNFLVKNNENIMKISRKILGKSLFEKLMQSTFYGQFVAGKDELEIQPIIEHLQRYGVKALIDYSAEEDVKVDSKQQTINASSSKPKLDSVDYEFRRQHSPTARTYFYQGESHCEKHMEIFVRAIDAVADATKNTGLVAIKLTALGRPQLLMKLSQIISYMRDTQGFEEFYNIAELVNKFKSLRQSTIAAFDENEEEMLCNLMRRVNRVAAYARIMKVRCMVDAEQTYMQPAINMITMEMMRNYNKEQAVVLNTYQCYLKSTFDRVRRDLAVAQRDDFCFGAKLVRGAYMEQERQLAGEQDYPDPINDSFEATTKMYEQTLSYLVGEIACDKQYFELSQRRRIAIMVASHNEDTVRFALKLMAQNGILPQDKLICFGQLYGMSDHVSFLLGQAGYSVYKYMPYGSTEEVLPYLGRRAIENHGFLDKLHRERNLLAKEIINRLSPVSLANSAVVATSTPEPVHHIH